MADIKKRTGAKMMVDEKDAKVLSDGGNSDYYMGGKGPLFLPVKTDKLLKDHDTISLGGTKLELLHHPGHTQGSCSYLLTVNDEKKSYKVLIANIPTILSGTKLTGMPGYAHIGKGFRIYDRSYEEYTIRPVGSISCRPVRFAQQKKKRRRV